MRYVDRLPVEALRREMPELAPYPMVRVDIVDDGERMESIGDGTQDFVIANHVLEQTQTEMLELLVTLRRLVTFDVELIAKSGGEVIVVMRKGPDSSVRPGPSADPHAARTARAPWTG